MKIAWLDGSKHQPGEQVDGVVIRGVSPKPVVVIFRSVEPVVERVIEGELILLLQHVIRLQDESAAIFTTDSASPAPYRYLSVGGKSRISPS